MTLSPISKLYTSFNDSESKIISIGHTYVLSLILTSIVFYPSGSLRAIDAYMHDMRNQPKPSLVQIMACRLFGAKPLSEQCCIIENKLQSNCVRKSNSFMQEIVFENVVCKMAAILSRPQCVKAEYSVRTRSIHALLWLMPWRSNELAWPSADMVISMLADDKWVLVFCEESLRIPALFHWKNSNLCLLKKSLYNNATNLLAYPQNSSALYSRVFPPWTYAARTNLRCRWSHGFWHLGCSKGRMHARMFPGNLSHSWRRSLCACEKSDDTLQQWHHFIIYVLLLYSRFMSVSMFYMGSSPLNGKCLTNRSRENLKS